MGELRKGDDIETWREEKAKTRIRIEFLCLIFSFLVFLIVISMDLKKKMYYLSIMN